MLTEGKSRLTYQFCSPCTFHIKPDTRCIRNDTGIIQRMGIIVFIYSRTVSAVAAYQLVPFSLHGEFTAAFRAPVEEVMHVLRHLTLAAVGHVFFLIPRVVILAEMCMELCFHFCIGHGFQLFRRKQQIHRHIHTSIPLIQTVFGTGQITPGNVSGIDRHTAGTQKFCGTQGNRLVGTGDAAHAFREDADAAATLKNPLDFAHGIDIRNEVFLRDNLQQAEYHSQVRAEKLIIACHKIHSMGQKRQTSKNIVQAGCMVADHNERSFFLLRIHIEFDRHAQFLFVHHPPDLCQNQIDIFRRLFDFTLV